MSRNSLRAFANCVNKDWGGLSTEVTAAVRGHMETLLRAAPTEEWLEDLHLNAPPNKELIRDPQHGFVLLAHTEPAGLYRPPHDHGRSWVIYAVVKGESKMGSYRKATDADGTVRLAKHGSALVGPGQVQVYLPGDIHDTLCVAGPALLYRFTERDLKPEDQIHHQITRYVDRNGAWTRP